jgi:phosphate acetyltransferase
MEILNRFIEAVRGRGLSVVLPEAGDQRIVAAARRLKDERIAEPILLGKQEQVEQAAGDAAVGLDGIRILDPVNDDQFDAYCELYAQRRDMEVKAARRLVKRPVFFGTMMVAEGHADSMVAGVAHATATVIQAGTLALGHATGIKTASSFFLMVVPDFQGQPQKTFLFADCAVNVDPTPEQLADIALASAASAAGLLDEEPRVAMLSFSTQGSAAHDLVTKVTDALAIAQQRAGDVVIDGEFQADTAIVADVARRKVKRESPVAGQANVLVFPDLNSGNIAYKLTQYLAGAQAIGPFLQGFAKPISDLSRGASVDDIVATSAIVLAQAAARSDG